MSMAWIPKPLSVGDGKVGAEEDAPAEAEAQRKRTDNATPEMIEFALQIALESKASIQRAFGGKSMRELYEEGQRKLKDAKATGDEPEEPA